MKKVKWLVEKFRRRWYNGGMQANIVRSRRKTLSLTVTREGEIVVRAPLGVSRGYISQFLERHTAWVEKRLKAVASKPVLDLSDGATLTLFGSPYRIASGRARIADGELYLPAEERERALASLLKKFSLGVMERVTRRVAEKYGFGYRSVRISSARGRWGSCNREGVIAYTFRVAFLPPEQCEYVAVHELAHTVVFNHSAEFWEIVADILPDWKTLRRELKQNPVIEFL